MGNATSKQLWLEDLLADLRYARRREDLPRLALISYCEVRRWARLASETGIAEQASRLITASPHASRDAFLDQVDSLTEKLEEARIRYSAEATDPTKANSPVGQTVHGAGRI